MHKPFFAHISTGPSYGSVLCLNGELPCVAFFKDLDLPVIALDGAANPLMDMGIEPSIVIGDLDSIKPEYLAVLKTLHKPDQNYSDFQKGMHYLKEHNLLPAIILGINGGHLDHILHNVNIFLDTESVCYAPPLVCYGLKRAGRFKLPIHTKISLMGIPNAMVTTEGLKWELNSSILQFPGVNSTFNRTASEDVSIQVHRGNVLVMVYLQEVVDAGLS
jgi:thiamine pyrophosphokinase